ncbi:MAG: sugar transferase [Acidimicrobiia bacterium]|nr:sugar transferase [Acidimicrobiia bacterium]
METDVTTSPTDTYARFFKPLLDRAIGLVLALATLPIVLVLLAMSWSAFGWPPVERVARIGKNGRRFNLYRVNTRKDHQTDLRGRPLRLSRWLRRTSLDELPQLWNVALGHMSLVGPRPLNPIEAAQLDGTVGDRNLVRPGLTGPWQVEARGDGRVLADNHHVDLGYLEDLSFRSDLAVLLATLPALFRRREQV